MKLITFVLIVVLNATHALAALMHVISVQAYWSKYLMNVNAQMDTSVLLQQMILCASNAPISVLLARV